MKEVVAVLLLVCICFLLFNSCGRTAECQRVYDQYGSTVGAYEEAEGDC